MIILREKIFRRNEFTEDYYLPISDEIRDNFTEEEIQRRYFKVESANQYGQDVKNLSAADKKVLNKAPSFKQSKYASSHFTALYVLWKSIYGKIYIMR